VFIVGHLRGKSRPKVFPIGESSQESNGTLGLQSPRQTAGSLRATDYKGTHNNIREVKAVLTPDRQEKRQNGRRFKENGEPSFTLTGQDLHGVMIDSKIRRLTPTECERLQGFPDGWTEGVSDTQRYKCLGNAVTTNVITAIGEKLCSQ
jgi:DNA (cytosine-5)-methyltransferase 1